MRHMLTAGTVATFAAHIPLCHLLRVNVVAHRVTTVTCWAGRSLHIFGWIVRRPPICARVWNVVLHPLLVAYVPLHRERIVVVSNLREVPLLPEAAVHESHLIGREFSDVVGLQVWDDRVRMLVRVADYVRHGRFLPSTVDRAMAALTWL